MNKKILGKSFFILCTTFFMAIWTCSAESAFSGKITERMESGGYVYMNLECDDGTRWVAAQSTNAGVGDMVTVSQSMEMKNFNSKTLDRTFPSIYFASTVTSPSTGAQGAMGSHHSGVVDQKPVEEVIKSLTKQEGCITIDKIFASKESLKGKSVKVQAVVTKFSPDILGANWIRMKDGTGEAGADTLMVTSIQDTSPGEIVVVEGVINYDYDLGSGYVYPAIIKDAKVSISKLTR